MNYSHLVYTICHDKMFQTLSISKLSYHLFSWIIVFLWHHISSYNLANIGPGNGLLPDGTKPLPELILANNLRSWAIQLMATGNAHDICPYCEFVNLRMKLHLQGANDLTHLPLMPHICVSESVKIMVCRLFGAKPLSKPMLDYCQLTS